MKPASNGLWSVSVALPAGNYQYRFLVDGEWRDDPECGQRAPNPFGSQNMVRIVSPVPRKSAPPLKSGKRSPARPNGDRCAPRCGNRATAISTL